MNEVKIDESYNDIITISDLDYIITIDPYYDNNFYNESIQALENNKIEFDEIIHLKNPYNFYIRLKTKQLPIMVNYDGITKKRWEESVLKVKPLIANDILKLFRFNKNVSSIRTYINNDAFEEAYKSDRTIIFEYKNKDHLISLSKSYGKIYVLGKYLNNSKKLAMTFNPEIKNVILPNNVYIDIGSHKLGELELKINSEILKNKQKIIKYSQTPYFKDGQYFPTKPSSPIKV